MASVKQQEISQLSEVSKFYDGKSLFITGAAGFLGSVLLEALLRCCPGIRRIYILLRSKKGVQSEDRKESIFKKDIFYKIKEKYPEVLSKVVVIPGDVAHDDLGMSSEDLYKVSKEVSIVFHCAATISFTRPLCFMMQQNAVGTNNVIELCKKLEKLDAFVYTSTAYSNCNRLGVIEEKMYKLPFTIEEVMEVLKNGNEEELMTLFSKCEPKYPNFYTFTKCIAEAIIAERATDLPACIVRPSIIICSYKGVLPGYIEDGSGITNLCLGVGKGFIRVMHCDPEKKANNIPVDVVVNTLIIGAYRQSAENLPSPVIYNCAASDSVSWTWRKFNDILLEMVQKYPLPNSFQTPSVTMCKNEVVYRIFTVFEHYGPAVVIDFLLWLSGGKPRLVKLYRFYDKNVEVLKYFATHEWTFKLENFQSLCDMLNAADRELFPIDMTNCTMEELAKNITTGAPMYKKNSDKFREPRLRNKYVPMYLTSFIKWTLLGGLASVFYAVLF